LKVMKAHTRQRRRAKALFFIDMVLNLQKKYK